MNNISLDPGNNTFVHYQVPLIGLAGLKSIARVYLRWVENNRMRDRSNIPFHYFRSGAGDMDFELKGWRIRLRGVRMREVGSRRARQQRTEGLVVWVVDRVGNL